MIKTLSPQRERDWSCKDGSRDRMQRERNISGSKANFVDDNPR